MKKFYKVVAKCGHVGVNNYVPVAFAISAENRAEAINKTIKTPRVKHNCRSAILSINPIKYKQYQELLKLNNEDPYLHAKCDADLVGVEGFEKRIRKNNKSKNITNVTNQFCKKINLKYKEVKYKLKQQIDYEDLEEFEYEYSL